MTDPYQRHRRLGRWYVSACEMVEYPGRLEEIQQHVVIFRASECFTRDAIEFHGRSADFDVVPEGDCIPLYRWTGKWERQQEMLP